MGNLKSSGAYVTERTDTFAGLSPNEGGYGKVGVQELRNFRVRSDGSLCRRGGAVPLFTLPDAVRGVYHLIRDGCEEGYAVAGEHVYFFSEQQGQHVFSDIGVLGSAQGKVQFLCYRGDVLLQCDGKFWALTPTAANAVQVYVPLYATYVDGVKKSQDEQPNLLTRKIRIRHTIGTNGASVLGLPAAAESIDAVVQDGVLLEPTAYFQSTISPNTMHMSSIVKNTTLDICLTMPEDFFEAWQHPPHFRQVESIGCVENRRLLFFGGDADAYGIHHVYLSQPTREDGCEIFRGAFPAFSALYLTEQSACVVGDGVHAVTGVCRQYDRSLIFTENETWMMQDESQDDVSMPLMIPINTQHGCSGSDKLAVLGNTPFTLDGWQLLSWTSNTDERDECNAQCISTEVQGFLDKAFCASAEVFARQGEAELWLYCPDTPTRILVWQGSNRSWVTFDGFVPRGLFNLRAAVGFFCGQTVFVLDEEADADTAADGSVCYIDAEYVGGWRDFGCPDAYKRLCAGTVVADCSSALTLTLTGDTGRSAALSMCGNGGVSAMRCRGHIGRFRLLRLGVRSCGPGRLRLHEIQVRARTGS